MSAFLVDLAIAYAMVMACVLALWLVSLRIRNVSIIDWFWGAGFVLIAVVLYAHSRPPGLYGAALALMPVLWGARLTVHIARRGWGKGEDPRYTKMRGWAADERAFAWLSLKRVFLLQGHVLVAIAAPVIVALAQAGPPALPPLLWLGIAVWLAGTGIEALADHQLSRFRADPANRGQIMQAGLWRYSRHPNYFGDAVVWTGIWIAACAHPVAALTVFSPVLMTHFLVNVTGVATLDKKMAREKPGYADYMARTSGFVPLPPRQPSAR